MEMYLLWAVTGIVLIIIEMLTGTFYLLVLGIAALAAAAAAYLGQSFWVQAVTVAAVSVLGVILIKRFRGTVQPAADRGLDVGQTVMLDAWISEADGLARVKYRNAQWEAQVTGERVPGGKVFYIHAVDGNTLRVSAVRPH
ncbi:MAG: NfeD family protein [Burkholderiales bacterium]|jgi:membrane protein implicated in regulation of membrane protease activity|nr:NfeD family protein [Burkholderiales bacterium]